MSAAVLPVPSDTLRLRRALPALVLLFVAAALAVWGLSQGDRPAPHADVTQLPAQLGTWQMLGSEQTNPKELRLSDSDLSALSLDSWTQRVYRDSRTHREITLLLEYRTLGRGAFNHRPESCYPAVGYVLSNRHSVPVVYGGQPGSAIAITADFNGAEGKFHQSLLYFFASGHQCLSSFWKQQVEMAFGRLQPENNGWAFARMVSEISPGDEAGALAAQQDFVRQASPAMIAALTADHTR